MTYLYHGTNSSRAILTENRLRVAPYGEQCISLTRSFEVAEHFALQERDGPGVDGRAVVLVLDGDLLRQDYEVIARPEGDWHSDDEEQEESVWTDIENLGRYLVRVDLCFRFEHPPTPNVEGEAA